MIKLHLLFISLTGLFVLGLGWVIYGVAASGAWSEKVMPKSEIKYHFKFAVATTIIGLLMFLIPLLFKP